MLSNKKLPRHVAIVMDGNGRWANKRFLPRSSGHFKGVSSVGQIIDKVTQLDIRYLTLFAFSSENWRRPADEIEYLMSLFIKTLENEVDRMIDKGINLRIVGDITVFGSYLQDLIKSVIYKTSHNNSLYLTIAANYGGRWDILQAIKKMLIKEPDVLNNIDLINEELLSSYLSMSWAPEPDLLIRTGGEKRLSNFLIWQLAYTELYFTDIYWPDFGSNELEEAFRWYCSRERRFGRTSAQLKKI
ncbi:undecaprenyl diphosphate synthase [Candidatus Kinetoplastibacterium blastocrithidii TCC012E]|uniref:Isoprenyl transferase n=1 Tax=Candidatus Kinetoplastidibacterium blastocrithidiae TCC012E TaxID=1208922 RepID=M1M3S1_9PROT|nr:polyprenyl diphosphate synthase [Candidatus Kinetoplastibacterium blastocrithidii]AFZ83633.1 undecaprenyl pyrophosphate synthase [Candidatus Kinetoplastibacterium blastocrithidii (ex Strigomonas culicis)]AGF49754.1 undecaprenyl diphosphate synthase [Candidatus Kinetoplastibacterium blastocrithidii TCC012E]